MGWFAPVSAKPNMARGEDGFKSARKSVGVHSKSQGD